MIEDVAYSRCYMGVHYQTDNDFAFLVAQKILNNLNLLKNMEFENITFPVCPFPKPRMTQRDRWKKRPVVVKYHIYKDSMKHYANEFNYCVDENLSLTFIMPFPKSYSKKKKMN